MVFENLTTQYLFHHKIRLLAACYRIQSLEYNICKIDLVITPHFYDMTQKLFLQEGGGVQTLSRHADHTCRGCGGPEVSRPTLHAQVPDAIRSTGRSREGTLNSKGFSS